MRLIAFCEVAPYERATLEVARFEGAECRIVTEALDARSAELIPEAEIVSVFIYSEVGEAVLARLPKLRLVVTRSTGFDHIDVAACRQRGIAVANVPSYGENTVAEHAFALLLAVARQLRVAIRKTRELDFSLEGLMGTDMMGKTLGVIGAGRIGRHVLRIGRGFGMRALAYDPHEDPGLAEREGFRFAPLDALLAESDVVSIHAALSPETHHLIDRAAIARMKPGAILINTARGAIVDSEALCEALHAGRLGGAGLDVLEGEDLLKEEAELLHRPLLEPQVRQILYGHALLRHENVVMTPHSAFFTREGVDRLVETSLEDIRAFLAGRPQNLVPGSPSAARDEHGEGGGLPLARPGASPTTMSPHVFLRGEP